MKILIVQQAPDLGGAELFMENLVKEWVKAGNSVTFYTNYGDLKKRLRAIGAVTKQLQFRLDIMGNLRGFMKTLLLLPIASIWYIWNLYAEKRQYDTILMCGYTEKLVVTLLARLVRKPVVWLEYAPMEPLLRRNRGFPRPIYRFLAKFPYKIITISENTRTSLLRDTQIDPQILENIYPGAVVPDRQEYRLALRHAKVWRQKIGIVNRLVIGNISRIASEKNQEALIRAFTFVKKKRENSVLFLVGSGPAHEKLKTLSWKLNVNDSVLFPGFVKDRNAALAMMDVFVFPSSWELEGFGLAIAEAMLMRRPIVAVAHGPITEIIEHEKTGLLVSSSDPQELARAIVRIIENPRLAQRLSENAYRSSRARFNIIRCAEQIHRVLVDAKLTSFKT